MTKLLVFNFSLLLTLLMFLGEIVIGFILYIYQIRLFSKNKDKDKDKQTFLGIKLIQTTPELRPSDNCCKIYLLIFMASFFDFVEFMLSTFYLPQFNDISSTFEIRLSGLLTIISSLFFIFLLKFPIFKHQIFSLISIFICLIIIGTLEFIFTKLYSENKFNGLALGIIFLIHLFNSLFDSIEKYLLEFNYLNPFKTLMIEGLFGFFFTLCFSFIENPFKEIISFYKNNDSLNFILLITALLLYLLI
jgi:hypothetical protein